MKDWIDVRVKLPDKPEVTGSNWSFINVTCRDGFVRLYGFNITSGKWYDGTNLAIIEPIAWRELPKPYKPPEE